MRRIHTFLCSVLLVLGLSAVSAMAQDADNTADLQKQLRSQFTLTKMSGNRADIVTAGDVLVLHKDGLQMVEVTDGIAIMNVYKGGLISQSSGREWGRMLRDVTRTNEAGETPRSAQHKFATGDTFWITAADVNPDGVVLMLVSDPINDIRYYGKLRFPYKKNAIPPAVEILKTIAEVVTVNPPAPATPEQPPTPPVQEMAPPPPPIYQPPAPPKTIALKQTKAEVVATWGQPQQIIKLPTKEVYVYPDMKVVFVAGKVADVK
jgi:hypothetical protein